MKEIKKSMNITKIVLTILTIIVIATGCSAVTTHNSLANKQEDVYQAKSKIDTSLQERYDLVPNVVSTVKAYMKHESDVFKNIADARAKIGSGDKEVKQEGQTQLDSAISRLLVLSENYPQLKSDKHATDLMSQLEMLETRILIARNDYNNTATIYNKRIRNFPSSVWAGVFGFDKVDLYKADAGASTAPTVNFDDVNKDTNQ